MEGEGREAEGRVRRARAPGPERASYAERKPEEASLAAGCAAGARGFTEVANEGLSADATDNIEEIAHERLRGQQQKAGRRGARAR